MKDVIIGIDAGTSVIKSVAFDLAGNQIAAHATTNTYQTLDGGGSEQDMLRTWADTAATIRGLADVVPHLATRTAIVALTGQGDGTWLIDADGEPVAPAWLWLDARAAPLVDDYRASPDDKARFAITATGLAACQQGPQLMWMARNAPEVLGRASHAMHCKDWLYFKLTGERATDPSEGTFTFGDYRTRKYSEDVVHALGLKEYRHLLPEMIDGTQDTTSLSASAAKQTGLLAGTPVSLGFVDVCCTALGAGLYAKGADLGCTIVGSTGVHIRLAQTPDDVTLNSDRTGYAMAMPVPGVLAQLQTNMASTINIDWLLDLAAELMSSQGLDKSRADLMPMIDQWIDEAQPASALYQPYISEAGERGPFIDANARAGFSGLSARHGFCDLMRSVVEGLALAGRDCYSAMGALPDEIRMTGGAARSAGLRGIFAAGLNAAVRTCAREEAGAAGAAMMAAVAIGQYDTMDACVSEWVSPLLGELETPDTQLVEIYERTYPAYVAAHQALRPVWKMIAESKGVPS